MGVSPWESSFPASSGSLLWRELGGQEVEALPWVHTQAGTCRDTCGFSQDPANWVGHVLSPLPHDWRARSSLDTVGTLLQIFFHIQRLQPCSPTIILSQRAKRGYRRPPSASRVGQASLDLFFWNVNSDHCPSPVRTTSAGPHHLLLPIPPHRRTSVLRGPGDARLTGMPAFP